MPNIDEIIKLYPIYNRLIKQGFQPKTPNSTNPIQSFRSSRQRMTIDLSTEKVLSCAQID